jgi:hypothetical protein
VHSCNTPTFVKCNSPYACNIGDQVSHKLTTLNVPQLETSFRSRNYFMVIVLETGDSALVARKNVFANARLG